MISEPQLGLVSSAVVNNCHKLGDDIGCKISDEIADCQHYYFSNLDETG